jgi:hypothetical protein
VAGADLVSTYERSFEKVWAEARTLDKERTAS